MQLAGGGAREGVVLAGGPRRASAAEGGRSPARIEVAGVPMVERCVRRMVEAGVERVAVAAGEDADALEALVAEGGGWGAEVRVVRGPMALEGALRALSAEAPLLVHDARVFSDLPLSGLYEAHLRESPLATLAVRLRATRTPLLFDADGLVGIEGDSGERELVRDPRGRTRRLDPDGVAVVSADLAMRGEGPSASDGSDAPDASELEATNGPGAALLGPLLARAAAGALVLPFRTEGTRWWDVGTPAGLEGARAHAEGRIRPGRRSAG